MEGWAGRDVRRSRGPAPRCWRSAAGPAGGDARGRADAAAAGARLRPARRPACAGRACRRTTACCASSRGRAPLIARSSLIRFWADWPVLQPTPAPLEDPANPGCGHLAALDGQIDAARADGLDVIVMPYRYPLWVDGRDAAGAGAWPSSTSCRTPGTGRTPRGPRSCEALWRRYAGRMTHFEVVNEPNLQLMPQRDIPERVAVMITTVDAIARRHGLAATCLAPSCSDADSLRVPPRMTRAAGVRRPAARRARRGGVRGRRPLGLVVPQLQRVRERRRPLDAPARPARGTLARPARARRRPAHLRDRGRRAARRSSRGERGAARRRARRPGRGARAGARARRGDARPRASTRSTR